MNILDQVLSAPGFSPMQLVLGMIMYLGWTVAYVLIYLKCRRDQTYGVPFAIITFNVVWELLWSFNLVDQQLLWFFVYGNRFWFIFDLFLVYQLLKYGRKEMAQYPLIQRHFLKVVVAALLAHGIGLYGFTTYFGDYTGSASSMTINLIMSILYIFMLMARWDDLRGLSYPGAWFKMVGTAAASVFLVKWLPAQYENGVLRTHDWVHEPRDYTYMYFIYVAIFLVDCVYIAALGIRRKQLADQAAGRSRPATA